MLLIVGSVACSEQRAVVRAPIADRPPPVAASAPSATAALAEAVEPEDVPEPSGDAPSIEGTTWALCSMSPSLGTYTFLPSGGVSMGGACTAHHMKCGTSTWLQNGDRVRFECAPLTIKARIAGTGDRMAGWWRESATPNQTHSACLQRGPLYRPALGRAVRPAVVA